MANIKISQLPAKGANLASTDLVEISEFNGSGYVSKSITGQEIIDAASGGSGVTDVTATAPLSSTGGSTPDIAITQAGAADDGYLSTGDWNAFNSKQNALVSGTNIKTINSTSILGSGNISVSGNPSAVGIQSGNATISNTAGATISKTITINANTLASSCVLDFTARMVRLSGTTSMGFIQVYKNTSNSLTGATMIAKAALFSGTDNINVIQRTFTITGGNLVFHNSGDPQNTDVITSSQAIGTTSFSVSTTNYILIAINNSSTDQLVINMAKLTQYA